MLLTPRFLSSELCADCAQIERSEILIPAMKQQGILPPERHTFAVKVIELTVGWVRCEIRAHRFPLPAGSPLCSSSCR